MAGMIVLKKRPLGKKRMAFSLVELLTVMAIIAILTALVFAAASGVMQKAYRSRASAEIQGMSAALESYKTDNGIYPVANTTPGTVSVLTGPPAAPYPLDPTPPGGNYQISSEALYQALSGQKFFNDNPGTVGKSYMSFKANQVGSPTALSYVKDPWNNSYGYSTGSPSSPPAAADPAPYNGAGFFDLWSTEGTTGVTASNPSPTNSWIVNWQ